MSRAWGRDLLHVDDGALGAEGGIAADLDIDGDGDAGTAEGGEESGWMTRHGCWL